MFFDAIAATALVLALWAWVKADSASEDAEIAGDASRLARDSALSAHDYAQHALYECKEAHTVAHQSEASTLYVADRLGVDLSGVAGRE